MSDGTHFDAVAPTAGQPQPLGLAATIGWSMAALTIPVLLMLLVLAMAAGVAVLAGTDLENEALWAAMIVGGVVFFGVIRLACRRSGWPATEYLALIRPKERYLGMCLLALGLLLAAPILAGNFGRLGTEIASPTMLMETVLWSVGVVIFAPIAEELLFRGFLYRGIAASRLGISGAIVVTSILWSAGHLDRTWLGHGELVVSGLALGWLRWRSELTVPTIAVHGLYNLTAEVLSFLG